MSVAEDSYVVLLATLCDWVIREEERAEDAREQKYSLLKLGRGNACSVSDTSRLSQRLTESNQRLDYVCRLRTHVNNWLAGLAITLTP